MESKRVSSHLVLTTLTALDFFLKLLPTDPTFCSSDGRQEDSKNSKTFLSRTYVSFVFHSANLKLSGTELSRGAWSVYASAKGTPKTCDTYLNPTSTRYVHVLTSSIRSLNRVLSSHQDSSGEERQIRSPLATLCYQSDTQTRMFLRRSLQKTSDDVGCWI